MALSGEFRTLILFTVMTAFIVSESQITSSLVAQKVCVGDDVDLDWVYGNAADMSTVTWSHTNSSSNTKTIMQLGLGGRAPTVIDNFNVVHKSNGGITLTNVNEGNSGSYKISVTYLSSSPVEDSVSVTVKDCKRVCRTIVIVSMVCGIFGALGLMIIVGGIPTGCFYERETLLLTSGVIGIVFDVLSLVLSIVVKVKECCKENCEDSECCEEDSECCKDWIDNAAIAFIVIPCLAVVASVIIFVLVKLDIIGLGGNGYHID